MNIQASRYRAACAAWSNRILILSLLGIGYLTLFPFQFHAGAFQAIRGNPLFLGNSGKEHFTRDFFLNVLLFVPFGFGISAQVCKRNGSLLKSFLWSLALGAFVSYAVEFTQLYIPERDSGWEDVFSNTTGSVAGFFLFSLLAGRLLPALSRCEDWVRGWLTPRRAAALIVAYFAVGFGISAYLQSGTRLSNWDPKCVLFAGNDASGRAPWAGKIFLLQIWNRPLSERTIRQLASSESAEDENSGLLARYDFRGAGPFHDQGSFLPPLAWAAARPLPADTQAAELGDKSWLTTGVPVENLTREIRKSGKFTIRVICLPEDVERGSGRIVSLSESADNVNFHLRQRGADLVFYFRNPLTETRSILAWALPRVFKAGKVTDLVVDYDGSDAFAYVDGVSAPEAYRLGPGASLFHTFDFVQTVDLEGYIILYHTLLFLPAGMIVGFAARNWRRPGSSAMRLLLLGWILPAMLFEALLIAQTGRRFWPGNVALSLVFELAGMLLINADGIPAAFLNGQAMSGQESRQAENN